jgi:hypothetical protein
LLIPHRPWCTNHSTRPHYALTSAKSDRLLAGATKSGRIAAAAIIPIIAFGFVDAAYLANEKAYRDLYNRIVAKIRGGNYGLADFGVLSAPADVGHYIWALSSWSVWPVYLGLIVAYMLVLLSGLLTY